MGKAKGQIACYFLYKKEEKMGICVLICFYFHKETDGEFCVNVSRQQGSIFWPSTSQDGAVKALFRGN